MPPLWSNIVAFSQWHLVTFGDVFDEGNDICNFGDKLGVMFGIKWLGKNT
jgi:hypothetical protein